MKHKSIIIIVLLLIVTASGLYGQWMYSKDAIINQTTNAGTGYQVRFTVNYGAGTDSGENVFLNSKCKTDFGDIRFFEGATALNYWMESMTTGSVAVFWVKLAGDLTAGALTVTLKYGNAAASTTSNGSNTFVFFDDFSGDLSKWTKHKTTGSYPQIENSAGDYYARCTGATTPTANPGAYAHTVLGSYSAANPVYNSFQNNAVEYRFRLAANGISEVSFRGVFSTNSGYKARSDARASEGQSFLIRPYTGGGAPQGWTMLPATQTTGQAPVPTANTWYRGTITAYGTNYTFFRTGMPSTLSRTDNTYPGAGEISLQNHYGPYTDYDWVAVRKFAGTEPTRGAWDEEITLPVELSSFSAIFTADFFVKLLWTTQSETGVSGFYIYRATENDLANAVVVSPLIDATNSTDQHSYEYTDSELYEPGTYFYWLNVQNLDGSMEYHGPTTVYYDNSANQGAPGIPVLSGLNAIYPNPFNPSTTIGYGLNKNADVNFVIYNPRGQIVRRISEGQKAAGNWKLTWNGTDDNGNSCSTGVYYIKMNAGKDSFIKKAVLLK